MNPDPNDPNHHVPPASPGDNWEDLDDSTERSRVGLPPRRVERGLPPKKEPLAEKVSLRTRILKMESGADGSPTDPDDAPAATEDAEEPPGKPPSWKRNGPVRAAKAKETVPDEPAGPPEEAREVAVVLPRPKLTKRGRVNEINPGSEKPAVQAARPEAIVAKIPASEPEAEPKDTLWKRRRFSRGERADWGGNKERVSMKWMLLSGLGVATLVVLAVVAAQRPDKGNARSGENSHYGKLAPAEEQGLGSDKGTDALDQLLESRPQAESIMAAFATAESPEDIIGLIHAPEGNMELIRKEWKPLGMKAGWVPGSDVLWYVKDGGGIWFASLVGVLGDFTAYRAIFRQDGGELKLDWKATVGYGSADFSDLKSGKGDGGEVRVWLSPTDFYTFSYPESEYRSFRVTSHTGEATLWGYVPRGSAIEEELLDFFQPGQITGELKSEVQAILSLGTTGDDSLPEQWLIKDVVRLDWLDD